MMQALYTHSPLVSAPTGEFYVGHRRLVELMTCSVQTGDFIRTRIDPVIREVLEEWQHGLSTVAVPSVASETATRSSLDESADALSAVLWVSEVIGVPPSVVAISVGIKERTFYDWKAKGRRPRLATQGQLWLLVQLVEDLASVHPDVSRWFKADPTLAEALRFGDFEYIATYDVNALLRRVPVAAVADSGSIGAELELPKIKGRRSSIQSRSSRRRASVRRSKSQSEPGTHVSG